jgi:hypothetical protein
MRIPIYPEVESFIRTKKETKFERLQEDSSSRNSNEQFKRKRGTVNQKNYKQTE